MMSTVGFTLALGQVALPLRATLQPTVTEFESTVSPSTQITSPTPRLMPGVLALARLFASAGATSRVTLLSRKTSIVVPKKL